MPERFGAGLAGAGGAGSAAVEATELAGADIGSTGGAGVDFEPAEHAAAPKLTNRATRRILRR